MDIEKKIAKLIDALEEGMHAEVINLHLIDGYVEATMQFTWHQPHQGHDEEHNVVMMRRIDKGYDDGNLYVSEDYLGGTMEETIAEFCLQNDLDPDTCKQFDLEVASVVVHDEEEDDADVDKPVDTVDTPDAYERADRLLCELLPIVAAMLGRCEMDYDELIDVVKKYF